MGQNFLFCVTLLFLQNHAISSIINNYKLLISTANAVFSELTFCIFISSKIFGVYKAVLCCIARDLKAR